MAFSSKFNPDGTSKDEITDNEWADETAKALRDAGFKIVRFGNTGMIYVGQCKGNDIPDGHGYMYSRNGDLHEGTFQNGRAHGEGTYVTAKGSELKGSWDENKRIGAFKTVDAKGTRWTEKYSFEGVRKSRTKDRVEFAVEGHTLNGTNSYYYAHNAHLMPETNGNEVLNPDYEEGKTYTEGEKAGQPIPQTVKVLAEPDEIAHKCWNCNGLSRDRNNHAWACRTHKGRWAEDRDYRGSGEKPGVWACCGKTKADEPGCTFSEHNLRAAE